jgi:hypothetical protein
VPFLFFFAIRVRIVQFPGLIFSQVKIRFCFIITKTRNRYPGESRSYYSDSLPVQENSNHRSQFYVQGRALRMPGVCRSPMVLALSSFTNPFSVHTSTSAVSQISFLSPSNKKEGSEKIASKGTC